MTNSPAPRRTKQRALIADALNGSEDFRTVQQVFAELRTDGHSVGLATVYRTLQAMNESGDADVIRTADGELAYRLCSTKHHHHLICRDCGRAVEIADTAVEQWTSDVAAAHGYVRPEHTVEVFATCADCA